MNHSKSNMALTILQPRSDMALGSSLAQRRLVARALLDAVSGSLVVPAAVLLAMGATPAQLGMFVGISNALIIGQLLGVRLLRRVPKAILSGATAGLEGAFVLVVAVLLMTTYDGNWLLMAVMALLLSRVLVGQIGTVGWMPLLQDNVSESEASRFFTQMRCRLGAIGLVGSIVAACCTAADGGPARLIPLLLVAGLAMMARYWVMRVVPEAWSPRQDARGWRQIKTVFKRSALRHMIVLSGASAGSAATAELIYFAALSDAGYSINMLFVIGAISMFGACVSQKLWVKPVERYGAHALMAPVIILLAVLMMVKAFVPGPDHPVGLLSIGIIAALDGCLFAAAFRLLLTKVQWQVIPPSLHAESFMALSFATGLSGLIMAPLAGWGVTKLAAMSIPPIGNVDAAYAAVIAAITFVHIATLIPAARLRRSASA